MPPCGGRRIKNSLPPRLRAECGDHVQERRRPFAAIPGPVDPADADARTGAVRGPEQDEIVNDERHRRRAADRLDRLTLGVLEAQILLAVAEGHLQCPAVRVALQDEADADRQVSAEEGLVSAPAARVPNDDDAHGLVAQRHIP